MAYVPPVLGYLVLVVAILAFPIGWISLGVSALRVGHTFLIPTEGASV